MERKEKESPERKLFRNYIDSRYMPVGLNPTKMYYTTLELQYQFRELARINLTEATAVLEELGFCTETINGLTVWVVFEKTDPISQWS